MQMHDSADTIQPELAFLWICSMTVVFVFAVDDALLHCPMNISGQGANDEGN